MRRLIPLCLLALAFAAPARPNAPRDEAPVGTATNWILGHRLLREGDVEAALRHLHLAYRAAPDEPLIAIDFQAALAAEGYVKDAIAVMDRLVAAQPDSTSWRLRRVGLNIRAGELDAALGDLRELRRRGTITLEVVSTEAAIHVQRGSPGTALDVYRDAMYILPGRRADLYLGMVDVLQQSGQTRDVPALLEEALAAEPLNPGLWLAYHRALAVLDRYDEALAAARRADREVLPTRPVPADPEDEAAQRPDPGAPSPGPLGPTAAERWPQESFRMDLADVYARTGELERAIAVLEDIAPEQLDPEQELWLTRLLIGTGRQEEASERLAAFLAAWPESGRAWFLRGKLAESRSDWLSAVKDYRRAVELDPGDPEIAIAQVRAMLVAWEPRLGRPADARGDTLRDRLHRAAMGAAARVPALDAASQLVLGYAFRAADDNERAAWRFGQAAEDPGLRLTALIQQSICYDEDGDAVRARNVLERLRREYPDHPEVANSLGYFLAEKDEELERAEKLVEEALAAEPNNGAYLDSLGWVRYRQGRYEEAFDQLVRAVNVLPDDPVILEHLGLTLLALGRADEALVTFRRALEAGGESGRLRELIERAAAEGP